MIPAAQRTGPRAFGSAACLVLLFLSAYLPLEEFALKWLAATPACYAALRLAGEALLYGALAAVALAHKTHGLPLPRTPIDRALALFLALALLALALGGGAWLGGLVNLRVLVRYVAAYYLAVYLDLRAAEVRALLSVLLVGALLQAGIGILQHLQGGPGEFWLPRQAELELGGLRKEFAVLTAGIEPGAVLGTTDHSVSFALFLLVAGVVAAALGLSARQEGGLVRAWPAGVVLLCSIGILFSYSRACLFGLGIALALLVRFMKRRPRVARLFSWTALLAPFLVAAALLLRGGGGERGLVREKELRVSPLESAALVFSERYVEHAARSSRLWVLREVGGTLLRSAGWLGFGPEKERAKEGILRAAGGRLQRLIAYQAFEDVYWVALLAYYGFLGLALFACVLVHLWIAAARVRAGDPGDVETALAAALAALIAVAIPLSFLVATFDFRTFAFYFWLLAGLVVRSDLDLRCARAQIA